MLKMMFPATMSIVPWTTSGGLETPATATASPIGSLISPCRVTGVVEGAVVELLPQATLRAAATAPEASRISSRMLEAREFILRRRSVLQCAAWRWALANRLGDALQRATLVGTERRVLEV